MTPEERRARAYRVAALMEEGELLEVLNDIEEQTVREWRNCHDANERDNLWRFVKLIEIMRSRFGEIAAEGRITDIRRLRA